MKFVRAIFLCITYPAIVNGQQSLQKETGKFSLGISYSAEYTFRNLNYSSENEWLETIRNEQEIPKYGFTTGISVNYKINNRFHIITGVLYSNTGYRSKSLGLRWTDQNGNYPVSSFTSYHHQFINVPVRLNYVFHRKRLTFFAGAGFSFNRYIGTRTTITRKFENGRKTRSSRTQLLGTNAMNLSGVLSAGLNYELSQRLSFRLEPVARRSITSIGHNSNSREYYYSIGLNSALMYSLRSRKKRS